MTPPPGAAVRPVPPSESIQLTFTLASRDPAGLASFDTAVGTPNSPSYRQFLSEATFEARYGPSPGAADAVAGFLSSQGARSVERSADGSAVSGVLTTGAIEHALGVSLVAWGSEGGRPIFTAVGTPTVPPSIRPVVQGIGGLSDAHDGPVLSDLRIAGAGGVSHRPGTPQFIIDNQSGAQWYFGTDFTQAYGVSSLFPPSTHPNATFPTNQAVATILLSAYNSTFNQDLPAFDPSVVQQYYNDSFPSSWPHPKVSGVPITVGGVTPPPPGPFSALKDTTLNEAENSLDLEMAGSIAPGATLVNFYFADSLFESSSTPLSSVADGFGLCLSAALAHNYGGARLAAVSNSFGLPDLNDTLWNTELEHAAAVGVTVVAASGDQGNAPPSLSGRFQGQWPTWPASAAFGSYGDVAVGGVSITLGGQSMGTYTGSGLPTGFDGNLTGIVGQSAWYDILPGPGNYSGSEGGASTVFPEPAWQFRSAAQPTIVNTTVQQGAGSLGRSEPDVAFAGNDTIAYVSADASGIFFEPLEGTSIASPIFAGMLASLSAVAGHPFAFLTPELYRIGSYFAQHPTAGVPDPYLDVTEGANFLFSAGPGWDAVTGWGSIDAATFLPVDANGSIASYNYTGPSPGLPPTPPKVPISPTPIFIVAGLVGVGLVLMLLLFGRSRTRPTGPFEVPHGAAGHVPYAYVPPPPPPGPYPGPPPGAGVGGHPPLPPNTVGTPPPPPGYRPAFSTFICPYCGQERPAEPVRCPRCGAL